MNMSDKMGWLIDPKIKQEHRKGLEHSNLTSVKAIVLHRTGTTSASSVLNAWKSRKEGTHFLIDSDGTIYQTASLLKQCWHVGKLYSKCRSTSSCSAEEAETLEKILRKKNISWGKKFRLITRRELKKEYPVRFPHNHDSLGIEIVGVISKDKEIYEMPNKKQLDSLFWLLDMLVVKFSLTISAIYAHGQIAHKDPNKSEGASALKAYSLRTAG